MYVKKNGEPPSLTAQRAEGTTTWEEVPGNVKQDIRRSGWIEQSGLCAFCCARLPDIRSLQRIAHVVPRDVEPLKSMDYENMVISCSSGRDRERFSTSTGNLSCDEAQGANVLPISPLQSDCEKEFYYLQNGAIKGTSVEASTSINILNLDCERLRRSRAAAIEGAELFRGRMSSGHFESVYLVSEPPHLPEFCTAISAHFMRTSVPEDGPE